MALVSVVYFLRGIAEESRHLPPLMQPDRSFIMRVNVKNHTQGRGHGGMEEKKEEECPRSPRRDDA
jgi:hypothetical protein